MEAEDVEAEERQPLLEQERRPEDPATPPPRASRASRRRQTHQQFRAARREAAQSAAMGSRVLQAVAILFGLLCFGFWVYITVRCWYVLIEYSDVPCDVPLSDWLIVKMVLDACSPQLQGRSENELQPVSWAFILLQNCWLGVGYHWVFSSKTCEATNPSLFYLVRFLVVFWTLVLLLVVALPLLLSLVVLVVVYLVRAGIIKNPRAADGDTLQRMHRVPYDPSLFSASDAIDDPRPSSECCCCCDGFGPDKVIVRTPCKHYYHETCLGDWLKLAKTCPLCRCDLDEAVMLQGDEEDDMEAGLSLGGSVCSSELAAGEVTPSVEEQPSATAAASAAGTSMTL